MDRQLAADSMERQLLGSILRYPDCLSDVLQIVTADDFRADAAQQVFRACVGLWEKAQPVAPSSVADVLHKLGKIEDIGGYVVLAEMYNSEPTGMNAVWQARHVREASILRRLEYAGQKIAYDAANPTGAAEEMLETAEREIFAISTLGHEGKTYPMGELIFQSYDRLDARRHQRITPAVPTGFVDIDHMLSSGLQPSEFVIVAARPSCGKTSLALCLAVNAARLGLPVLFVSLEQSKEELSDRLLCSEARIDSRSYRKGFLSDEETQRVTAAGEALRNELGETLHVDDRSGQGVLAIMANARRLKQREGIRAVFIDYIQLIEPDNRKESREQQVSVISRRLKHLARETGIPVVALAQLNRQVENRADGKPKLSDLRESGSLEQDADTVMLLHRQADEENVINVDIAKQRNGPTGEVKLTFERQYMRFHNYAAPMCMKDTVYGR